MFKHDLYETLLSFLLLYLHITCFPTALPVHLSLTKACPVYSPYSKGQTQKTYVSGLALPTSLKRGRMLFPASTRASQREEASLGSEHLSAGEAHPLWAPGEGVATPEPYLSWAGSS